MGGARFEQASEQQACERRAGGWVGQVSSDRVGRASEQQLSRGHGQPAVVTGSANHNRFSLLVLLNQCEPEATHYCLEGPKDMGLPAGPGNPECNGAHQMVYLIVCCYQSGWVRDYCFFFYIMFLLFVSCLELL